MTQDLPDPKKEKRTISLGMGILALVATIPVTLVLGILFSFEGEYVCSPPPVQDHTRADPIAKLQSTPPQCSQKFVWKGWSGVPLQGLGGAIGTAFSIYSLAKAGGSLPEFIGKVVSKEGLENQKGEN